MKLEKLIIKNFHCFGPKGVKLEMTDPITTLIGANGSGKTAAFRALSRMFGIGGAHRNLSKSDFHLGADKDALDTGAELQIEAIFSFPELDDGDAGAAVAEFWNQMSANTPDEPLIARIVLKATWTDDGTPDGIIEPAIRWVTRMDDDYKWEECKALTAAQRSAIQVVYVPANRGSVSQVKSLLRGRLWRAARWSDDLRRVTEKNAISVQKEFNDEDPIKFISKRLSRRWKQVNEAGTSTKPILRLAEDRFEAVIRNADVRFSPDAAGAERDLSRLSDGQKSLFQIALTAATLEIEQDALKLSDEESPFEQAQLRHIPLTLLLIEEPENSLSAFFLSRIMDLCKDIGRMETAQVLLSSHSSSILSRVQPEALRYFRLDSNRGHSEISALTLPAARTDAGRYVRQAVRAYPELYFAKFVILVEGDSEQIVLPKLAEARGLHMDRAFCPIVPLGGRHVDHFWTLLHELSIPHITLLDLDYGRQHGGAHAIRNIVKKLNAFGLDFEQTEPFKDGNLTLVEIDELTDDEIDIEYDPDAEETLNGTYWLLALRELGVFFSEPLDLDFSMLIEFSDAYMKANEGGYGPSKELKELEKRKKTTLKKKGNTDLYDESWNKYFQWYPYLFLSKSKPASHLSALNRLKRKQLKSPPEELGCLLDAVAKELG